MSHFVLSLLASASVVSAHCSIWHPSVFGFNGIQTGVVDTNTNAAVNPLFNLTFDNFWFQSINKTPQFPPLELEFMNLVSGGATIVEIGHNRACTTFGRPSDQVTPWPDGMNHVDNATSPYRGPPLSPPGTGYDCIGNQPVQYNEAPEGNLHTQNRSMAAGTAIAISYVSDLSLANITNHVVISTAPNTPFNRLTTYQIPAGLPPCPAGGCVCSFLWIPNGCGTPNEYMQGFRCIVTGATVAANKLLPAKPPVYCGNNAANCVKGSKQVMIWNQKPGTNNVIDQAHSPAYGPSYGFGNGAQTDIFASGAVVPTATQSTYTATSTPPTIVTSTAAPTTVPAYRGFNSMGCYTDSSNSRGLQYSYVNANMTAYYCMLLARSFSLRFAAVEFGSQCFMGNTLNSTSQPGGNCNMACPGNQTQTCGGSNAMSLYQDSTWIAPSKL